jgi:phosphoribosyl 1,2-cyclic phosphate phosphodiesterase
MMKVTFLGSGTSVGVPVPRCTCQVCTSTDPRDQRLRSSILVESDGQTVMIDCGPDFRQQALRVGLQHIDAILLTHLHYDHCGGLDDLRPYAYAADLPVYAEAYVGDILRDKYDYIFVRRYPGVARIDLRTVTPEVPFTIGRLCVTPLRLMHGRLPIVGYRIGALAYLTDCTEIDEAAYPLLEGIDTLIIDALRWKSHPTHMNVEQALAVVDRLHPRHTYFTHISDGMGLHRETDARLPEGVHLAYDGLVLEVTD